MLCYTDKSDGTTESTFKNKGAKSVTFSNSSGLPLLHCGHFPGQICICVHGRGE